MPTTSFLEPRVGVEAALSLPVEAIPQDKLVKFLGYPVELFGVSSQSLSQTLPGESPDGLPRISELTPGNYLFWVVVRDYGYESGADELKGPGLGPDLAAIRARPARRVNGIPPLAPEEQVGGPVQNVSVWRRDIGVSAYHYVTVFGFAAGAAGRAPKPIGALMESMELRDYT